MNLNSVILEGVVSGEPHLKETKETSVLNFTSEVRIVGRLKQNKWTDKDGVSHSEVQIMAEHIEIKKAKEA